MAEKRLYRIEGLAYAWAETWVQAIKAVQIEASLHDMTFEAYETTSADAADWRDVIPYGGEGNLTCAQLLQAQEKAQRAAELATFVDANQLPLGCGEGGVTI